MYKSRTRSLCASSAFVALSLVALRVSAQTTADPAAAPVDTTADATAQGSDANRRDASAHFRMGVGLYEEGDFQGALAEFERANQAAPSPVVLYNIAQTHLALRDYVAASDALAQYLELGGARIPAARREEVRAQLETLTMRIGRIRVVCNVDDAAITIDGRPVGRTPVAQPIRVSLGRHQIVIRAPMREPDERTVTIAGNTEIEVAVEFPPIPETPLAQDAPSHVLRRLGWASTGLGIGAGVAGAATFGLALSARGRYGDATSTYPADDAAARDARDDVHRFSLISDITTGVGIAAGGAGIVMLIVDRRHRSSDEAAAATAVLVLPSRNGMVVTGRF